MGKVKLGSKVSVIFENGDKETFQIVPSGEADIFSNKVSVDTLFGKAVNNHSNGEKVWYENSLKEKVSFKILEITN